MNKTKHWKTANLDGLKGRIRTTINRPNDGETVQIELGILFSCLEVIEQLRKVEKNHESE